MNVQKNEQGAISTIHLDGTQYHPDFGTGGREDLYNSQTPTDQQIASGVLGNAAFYSPDQREEYTNLQTKIEQEPLPVEITGSDAQLLMSAGKLYRQQTAQGDKGGMPEAKPFLGDLEK